MLIEKYFVTYDKIVTNTYTVHRFCPVNLRTVLKLPIASALSIHLAVRLSSVCQSVIFYLFLFYLFFFFFFFFLEMFIRIV